MSSDTIKKCAFCAAPLVGPAVTREHIIPSAIGGRRTTTKFICAPCNQRTGNEWDAPLAKELHHMSVFFEITRDRLPVPRVQTTSSTGEIITLAADGQITLPVASVIENEMPGTFRVRAPNLDAARIAVASLKRKHGEFDVDKVMAAATEELTHLSGMVKLTFSLADSDSLRAVVKSAVAMAVDSGIDAATCVDAISFLRGEDVEPPYGMFYTTDVVKERPVGVIFHAVTVFSVIEERQLLAYVELFSTYRLIVVLSSRYDGAELTPITYALNPVTGKTIDIELKTDILDVEISKLYAGDYFTHESLMAAFNHSLPIAMSRKFEREQRAVSKYAFADAWKRCGAQPGEYLNETHIATMSQIMATTITNYIISRRKLNKLAEADPGYENAK
ncbi:MAG: HNH endonuclease [Janthinobacterium lividum]